MGMITLTPTERLEWLLDRPELADAHGAISKLLEQYERFLKTMNAGEEELVAKFMNKKTSQSYMSEAYTFGDLVFEALTTIGKGTRFHRLLVV